MCQQVWGLVTSASRRGVLQLPHMNKAILSVEFVFLLCAAPFQCGASDFPLAGERGCAVVVVPECADEATTLAAAELTNYVFKASGRLVQVQKAKRGETDADGRAKVVIGTVKTLSGLPAGIVARLAATDNPEAACLECDGGTLWIVGKDEVADLYATYHFLEAKLGVRWFKAPTPEDDGEFVPRSAELSIAPFSEFREPRFRIRRLDKCYAATFPLTVTGETAAVRNGYQVFPPYGHTLPYDKPDSPMYKFYAPRCPRRSINLGGGHLTFVKPMPPEKFFDAHPEYFAEIDGRRVRGEQYCFSNPEVQSNAANYVVSCLDKFGGDGRFTFGMVDVTHGWCECARCRALDPVPANGEAVPNVSTRFNIAVRNMADMIWSKWPKADLNLWAYHTYRILPVGVRQDPRMKVQFCDHGRCYGHRLDDPSCQRNAEILALMKGWLAVTPKLYTYEYFTCSDALYSCHEKDEAHDLRLYDSLGLVGWKNEAAFTGSRFVRSSIVSAHPEDVFPSVWQWLYVTSKLLWNPNLDEDAILDDAEAKYYGVAYPAMRRYHSLRRRLWAGNRNCLGYPTGDQRRTTLLDVAGSKDELLSLLDEAERLAAGDRLASHRVSLDRKFLTRYWIEPNELSKAKMAKAFRAEMANSPVTVDGAGDEDAWKGAYSTDELYSAYSAKKEPIDDSLETRFWMLRGKDCLYFRVKAKEPSMPAVPPRKGGLAWQGDGVEIFLFPPNIDNRYYQIAVTPGGQTFACAHPAGRGDVKCDVEAKGRATADGWELEIMIPTGGICALRPGDAWRVLLCRNRMRRDGGHGMAGHYSSDACGYHDTTSYHPMLIGENRQ